MSERQVAEFVIVCSAGEADALLDKLKLVSSDGDVAVEDLSVEQSMGMVKGEKVIAFALSFSVSVAAGVVGNKVYAVLTAAPAAQCVVEREALPPAVTKDQNALDAKIRSAAKPQADTPLGGTK